MYTKQQRLEIYFTAYCCLDGEECGYTGYGLCYLLSHISVLCHADQMEELFPEIHKQRPEWAEDSDYWTPKGSAGWPERKEILIKAIELTYKK